jgi:putative sigma-54 modulation protein
MPVSAAVLELDFTGAPVLVFRHASSGRVNIVYRRSDGNIGWIDPSTQETKRTSPSS